jgi:predicted alpha/beta-fold hydrolase
VTAEAEPAPRVSIEQRHDFRPPRWLAAAHEQTILAAQVPRSIAVRLRGRALIAASTDHVLDCGNGVRLLGHYAPRANSRSLVVLHHGWEGSADALYVLSMAQHLWQRGHAIFRLNLRDHGPTHHLNPEIFHSCRIEEVVGAVAAIQQQFAPGSLSLVGFSLGGNFALRVAARAGAARLKLAQVLAICPVLDPVHTLAVLDGPGALYRRYFVGKWRGSLTRKQAAWPELYDFADLARMRDLTSMTALMVHRHSEFADLMSYLRGYAITEGRLESLASPARILAALDDPIIPAVDLHRLWPAATLKIEVTARGGHCGFLDSLLGPSWADRWVAAALESQVL